MSLEKFQATDAWRNKFKNLLFTERKPSSIAPRTQRLSIELSEDLQVILEEKKIPRSGSKMPRVRNPEENKENLEEQRLHNNTLTKTKPIRDTDATLIEDQNDTLQITNTSFGTLEEMCEKTASDPDSTLFQYLNRSSMMRTRASKAGRTYDEEAAALQRLLDELNDEESQKRLKAQSAALNVTQLEDVEAPTCLWENTIVSDALQSISPVKLVGLLRQSTIMEECSDTSEGDTSANSYQSAARTGWSTASTGCYDTANDTVTSSEHAAIKKEPTESVGASTSTSSLELFQPRHERQKFFKDEKDDPEESFQLIDFEKTVTESGVCPIASDSLEQTEPEDSLDPPKSSPESTQSTESDESDSIIEVSEDDESSMGTKILEKIEKLEAENLLNRSFTIESEEPDEEKSLHFNDTMEEVEYMMKKGMQYMEAAKIEPVCIAKTHVTPVKQQERYRSPSPMLSSPATPKTVITKPKPVNKHTLDIKPFPKLDLFKKPQPTTTGLRQPAVQNKFVSSVKKHNYAHVISPIGTYIKKSATTPFISTIKAGCSVEGATSKVFKQLEFDSRVKPQEEASAKPASSAASTCSLPMKAYISSEYKHIVDDRTKFTIPGGPKVKRYIQPSLIPAVVRHEGKVKIPANLRTSDMAPPPRRTNDSLADLSLMSGDVSVYTIKDAQKF